MSTVVKDLGAVSAYAYAVEKGYTGTEEEFAELMASYATVGQTAVNAAQTATTKASEAATSATTATNKASEATTAATTATTKAGEASTSASTATSAKDTAVSASQTATSKATEATTAAATAVSAKDDAVSANTAAQSAKTAAQTAQAGAETAAASVQSSAAQIQTNADDISELKEDTTQLKSELDFEINRSYNANFDLSHIGCNDNGVCLKSDTGNAKHNNILWLKETEGKSVALLESICNIPNVLNNAYARFFISGANKDNYYYLPITFTSNGEVLEIYRWQNNSLQPRISTVSGNVVVTDFTKINIKILYDNGGVFLYINNTLACFTDLIQVGENAQIGVAWPNANVKVYHKISIKEKPTKYVHISVDDVRYCLKDITDNASNYTSIFQNSFFAKLKEWHNSYGAVFTLNVFNYFDDDSEVELLSNVPTKYKDEFVDVSNWLKFAVHSPQTTDYYADYTDADVVSTYTNMISNIIRFAGVQSVDSITRFGYFSINQTAVVALRTSGAIFIGCLTSDDNRTSDCGLSNIERTVVQNYGQYYDFSNKVVYIKSIPRLDDYTEAQNIAIFKARFAHLKWSRYFEIFFHEGSASDAYADIEALLPIVRNLGIKFDYGINNILL